ncbi:MAG: hypothetical protein ACTH2Q_00545 [Propionibacteriaceae bacterium]
MPSMSPFSDADSFVVNTEALKAAEPRMDWLSEQFATVAAYLETAGSTVPPRSGGGLSQFSDLGGRDIVAGTTDLVLDSKKHLDTVFDRIVTTRQRYEQTEEDNIVSVDDLFAALGPEKPPAPSPEFPWPPDEPATELPTSRDEVPRMPDRPDVSALLTDPVLDEAQYRAGPPARAVREWLEPSGGVTGEMIKAMAYPYTPAHMSDRILAWVAGADSGPTNFWQFPVMVGAAYHAAARAVAAIANATEAVFTYVGWVWSSRAKIDANGAFHGAITQLKELEKLLTGLGDCEQQVAACLSSADRDVDGGIHNLWEEYASYYDLTLSIGGSGAGLASALETVNLKIRAISYANAFEEIGSRHCYQHAVDVVRHRRDARELALAEGADVPEMAEPDLGQFTSP